MSADRLFSQSITNVRPFDELSVDAAIWREAHEYHQRHRQLHALTSHRPGIVSGLEVFSSRKRSPGLVIAPGVAIDAEGRTIVLREPLTFTVTEARQVYVVIRFEMGTDPRSAVPVGSGTEYFREIEGRDVIQTDLLPRPEHLELARIFRSGKDQPIRDAPQPLRPMVDEINLLHRCPTFPACLADLGLGELAYVPDDRRESWCPNRAGLVHLLRMGSSQGLRLWYTGPVNLRASLPARHPGLLYMSGRSAFSPLADRDLQGLREFTEEGGILFAEACSGGEGFEGSFRQLCDSQGWKMQPLAPRHPVLSSHHQFPAVPPGGRTRGSLQADAKGGVFFSSLDYGAAWQGQVEDPAAPGAREQIRGAIDFGMNVACYAAQRVRRFELERME